MIKHLQSFAKSMGDYGCYFLCLCNIAKKATGKDVNIFKAAEHCISQGGILFDYNNYANSDNFYMSNPALCLEIMTGKKWSVRHDKADYKAKNTREYVVELWSTNGKTGHFAMTKDGFNSLEHSHCVDSGKIISTRVLTCID